ncbi:elongation factor kinase, partial [Thalassiosira pseudonana CCMP1335]
ERYLEGEYKKFNSNMGYVDKDDIFDSKESAPQPFSHFTYEKSKNFFMVVDLQGVLTINNDGTKCYELTDPVIHKHRSKKNQKQWSFGRTDRGEKGMLAFFETHKCTQACKLLGLTEVEIRGDHLHYV